MYCPSCGDHATQGLSYCKRCGAALGTSAPTTEPPSFARTLAMFLPVALVSIAGFIALFATVFNLGERQTFDSRALVAIMAFGGATVVGVVGLFVWLVLRLSNVGVERNKTIEQLPREYRAPQLQRGPVVMPSVTENTTRNFDPVSYREGGSQE